MDRKTMSHALFFFCLKPQASGLMPFILDLTPDTRHLKPKIDLYGSSVLAQHSNAVSKNALWA